MTEQEQELLERVQMRDERIYELEDRIKKLESILKAGICKQCGGVSWDIPLVDYCQCNDKKHGRYAIVPAELLDSTYPVEDGRLDQDGRVIDNR